MGGEKEQDLMGRADRGLREAGFRVCTYKP